MKKRWMKSILETSTQPMPALPFQRGHRTRKAPAPVQMLKIKTA